MENRRLKLNNSDKDMSVTKHNSGLLTDFYSQETKEKAAAWVRRPGPECWNGHWQLKGLSPVLWILLPEILLPNLPYMPHKATVRINWLTVVEAVLCKVQSYIKRKRLSFQPNDNESWTQGIAIQYHELVTAVLLGFLVCLGVFFATNSANHKI